jgi:hypothetical protein
MAQVPNAPQESRAESKFVSVVRAVGTGVMVLLLWLIDKAVVRRLPTISVWHYVIGGVIVAVGLVAVLSFSDRLNHKNS